MKTTFAVLLLVCGAALAAQDYHSSFSHHGVGCVMALGHDAEGNLYVAAGGTGLYGNNQTFYPGPLNTQPVDLPEWGFIVSKHAPDNTLLWWRGFSKDPNASAPGDQEMLVYDMEVSDSGDVFVVGTFAGTTDFDPGAGTFTATAQTTLGASSHNGYLVKLNAAGDFQWLRTWRGSTETLTVSVAPSGNIHVSGVSEGGEMDMDPTAGQDLISDIAGNYPYAAGWISTLDGAGNYLWGHFMTVDTTVTQQAGLFEMVAFSGSAVDSAGNLVLTGIFGGSFIPSAAYAHLIDPNQLVILTEGTPAPRFVGVGNTNILAISYDPAGNRRWLRHYSSDISIAYTGNQARDVAVDDQDAVYLTGGFRGQVSFDPPNEVRTSYGATAGYPSANLFLQKLDAGGNHEWTHTFSTPGDHNVGSRLLADETGVVVAGSFDVQVDLDPGVGSAVHYPHAGYSFLAKYDKQGTYRWSKNFGSTTPAAQGQPGSNVLGISMTGAHRVVVGGQFLGDFREMNPRTQTLMTPYNGQPTSFVMLVDQTSLHALLQINQTSVPDLLTGVPVSFDFTVTGGSEVGYAWSISRGGLPPGITLSGTTGAGIQAAGTVMQPGVWDFELTVEDDIGNVAHRSFTWSVSAPPLDTGRGGGDGRDGGCAVTPKHAAFTPLLLLVALLALRGRRSPHRASPR